MVDEAKLLLKSKNFDIRWIKKLKENNKETIGFHLNPRKVPSTHNFFWLNKLGSGLLRRFRSKRYFKFVWSFFCSKISFYYNYQNVDSCRIFRPECFLNRYLPTDGFCWVKGTLSLISSDPPCKDGPLFKYIFFVTYRK